MPPAETLQSAILLHQQGAFSEAEAAYRRVVQQDAKNADALALLGTVLSEQKKHVAALAAVEQALAIDPNAALFHFYHGNALAKAGRAMEAEAAFTKAASLAPTWPDAWYNLGNAQRALKKNDAAHASYAKALALNPAHALTHNNLAVLYLQGQDLAKARAHGEEALRHAPGDVQVLLTLHDIALEQNDLPTAQKAAEKAVVLRLGDGDILAHIEKGNALDEQCINCLLALAVSLMMRGALDAAHALIRAILAHEPDMEEAHSLLGSIALARNDLDAAEAHYAHSFMLDPSYTGAPWNRAMVQLTKGHLAEGFRRTRWRWHALEKLKGIALDGPMWDGGDLQGKTLLLHEEQGFGDSLQMLRFAPELKKRGATVWFYARAPLYPLLENWTGVDKVLKWSGEKTFPPGVDLACGVMDLPGLLGINLKNIPATVPYLPNPKKHGPAYRLKSDGLKVGLVWSGNPQHKRDHERSIPLESLRPLTAIPGIRFFSLQFKAKDSDLHLMREWGITDLAPRITDLADSGAFLGQLDLLITVDSAPLHLAGALGIKTWGLVTLNPDWRWLLDREDSPWYPTLRLFRQTKARDWTDVVEKTQKALKYEGERKY